MKKKLVILIAFILCFMGSCQQRQEEQTELPGYVSQEDGSSEENKVSENEAPEGEFQKMEKQDLCQIKTRRRM